MSGQLIFERGVEAVQVGNIVFSMNRVGIITLT